MMNAVEVSHVSKKFRIYHERNQSLKVALMRGGRSKYDEFWALNDVNFTIEPGQTFGLVGHNGSGKSTLLKCMARILVPDSGSISTKGKVSALLELGAGFHPELSGRDNVYLNGSILGLSKKQIDSKFDEIVGFAGLEQFIDTPVKNYSSGMYVRLGFSVAINVDPDVLMVDEVLAVGDEEFQRRCMDKFKDFKDAGKTIVVVSHALGTVRTMCDRVAWLDHGNLLEVGDPASIIDKYENQSLQKIADSRQSSSHNVDADIALRLTDVSLFEAGRPSDLVHTGAEVSFRIAFEADEETDVALTMWLHSERGEDISVPNTFDAMKTIHARRGTSVVEFKIPKLMLLAGSYDVAVSLTSADGMRDYDLIEPAVRFIVGRGEPSEQHGLFSLGGTWRQVE